MRCYHACFLFLSFDFNRYRARRHDYHKFTPEHFALLLTIMIVWYHCPPHSAQKEKLLAWCRMHDRAFKPPEQEKMPEVAEVPHERADVPLPRCFITTGGHQISSCLYKTLTIILTNGLICLTRLPSYLVSDNDDQIGLPVSTLNSVICMVATL